MIQETRVGSGFAFKDVPHGKISSVEYGSKVSLLTVALGAVLGLFGLVSLGQVGELGLVLLLLGAGLVAYAFWRRRQVLSIQASGGVQLSLSISKGQQVDEFLWYLHAEREKRT